MSASPISLNIRFFNLKKGEIFNEIAGTPYYMAPKVLKRNYSPEIDVWSVGVIYIFCFVGSHHFGKYRLKIWFYKTKF